MSSHATGWPQTNTTTPPKKAAEITDDLTNKLTTDGAKDMIRKGMTETKMEELLEIYRRAAENPKLKDFR